MTDGISLNLFDGVHGTQPLPRELSLEELAEFLGPENPPFVTREERKVRQLFSMNIYKEGTTRKTENVAFMTGIVFDFDNKDDYVSIQTITHRLDQKEIAYGWYTTHSHTETRPKWRLILPFASPLPVDEWMSCYQKCLILIGTPPGIDEPSCKDIAHMWYPPYLNAGQPYEAKAHFDRYWIQPLDVDLHMTPEEKVRYETFTQQYESRTLAPVLPALSLKPLSAFNLKQALHIVSYLNANCDYALWMRTGKALHHQFEGSLKAFKIWSAWSAQRERLDHHYDAREIRNLLHHRMRDVLYYLYPNGKESDKHFRIGDVQGHDGESMKIELDGDKAGLWHDFGTGEGGDIFDLWGHVKGLSPRQDFPALLKDIGSWLGYSFHASPSEHHDDSDLLKYWHRFQYESPVGIDTLIQKAKEGGYKPDSKKESLSSRRVVGLDIIEFAAMNIPLPQMLVDPIIPEQGLAMLYAPRGIGKTYLSLSLAYIAASGKSMLEGKWRASQENNVVFLDGEMPAGRLQHRLKGIIHSIGPVSRSGLLTIITPDLQELDVPDLSTEEGQRLIEEQYLQNAKLLVLDNLSCLFRTGRENEGDSWNSAQAWFLRLRRKGISVLLIHHANKNGQQRGTSKKEDVMDTVIALRRPEDYDPSEGARFEVHYEKARHFYGDAAEPFEVQLKEQDDRYFWVVIELAQDDETQMITDLYKQGLSVRNIAKEIGLHRSKVERKLQKVKLQEKGNRND